MGRTHISLEGLFNGKTDAMGLTIATPTLLPPEFPFGAVAVKQHRHILAALYVAPGQAAGGPYATEVAIQILRDAINDWVVAHQVVVKFLQSLNGPVKMAH